jgi:RadC-like JAB domain-containing protein
VDHFRGWACRSTYAGLASGRPATVTQGGDPTPSSPDRAFARWLREAEPYVGVNVVDSLVIGAEGRAYSIGQESAI